MLGFSGQWFPEYAAHLLELRVATGSYARRDHAYQQFATTKTFL